MRLSVVQIHSHDYGGGAEAVARLNHRALKQLGNDSQLIVANKSGKDEDINELIYRRGFPGTRRLARNIEANTGLQYTYSPSLRQVGDQFRCTPDVIHFHALHSSGSWADLVGFQKLTRKYPTVCSLQDLWWLTGHCAYGMECGRWQHGCGHCPDLARYPSVPKDATAWNWKRKKKVLSTASTHFIAPSEWVKGQAERSPIVGEHEIHVVPNPIDIEVFNPGDKQAARKSLGIPVESCVVMVAANHLDSQFKGVDDAITVLKHLDCHKTFAILVGKNSDNIAEAIPLKNVSLGYLRDATVMANCYRAADVFLISSRVETFGLVAAEAVACGSAVVGYEAGGLKEVIAMGDGISVENGNTNGLLEATSWLLKNSQERRVQIAQAQSRVLKAYSPRSHALGCLRVYTHTLAEFRRISEVGS